MPRLGRRRGFIGAPKGVGTAGGMAAAGDTGFFNPDSDVLYTVDLFTGATSPIGTMQADIRGLAIVPAPGAAALLALAGLASRPRRQRR